jgi:hypothetical protein
LERKIFDGKSLGKSASDRKRLAFRPVTLLLIVLMVVTGLVYSSDGTSPLLAQTNKGKSPAKADPQAKSVPRTPLQAGDLPMPVAEVRDAMIAAAQSGNIAELKLVMDLNEIKPELAETAVADPIAYWKQRSVDGTARDVLAALWTLLEGSFVTVPFGRDLENNKIYVWPALAEKPLDQLTVRDEVELLRLMSPAEAQVMKAGKRYTGWRLTIGADGTWHSFRTGSKN